MSDFKCLGGACPETCCSSFLVDVDRATFRTYMAVKEPGLGDELRRHVKKRGNDRTDAAYARIGLTSAGVCPFLDGDKLCSIQNKLGEGALSGTCRAYPRETWARDGRRYLGGKLSCPEAARLCVSSPDAMVFPDNAAVDAPPTVRGAVHVAVEQVTRDPALPVWKAILFAGVAAETFLTDNSDDEPADAATLQSIQDFATETSAALLEEDFVIGDQALTQLKTLAEIAVVAAAKCDARHSRFPTLLQDALGAILGNAEGFEGAVAQYIEHYRQRFQPFDAAHDHALRNFVLNYLYVNQSFLIGPVLPQFQNLAVRFGVMRLLLIGLSGLRSQGLTLDDYATVISSASKVMDHDPTVSLAICAALDAAEPRSVPLAVKMVIPPG